ncbi:helix-turn-helix domain-containing protein [Microbacterium sp. IO18]|uniref:helix-turn-helix domain-containing protein n=1 Tax=Microbacterium sp. IO18 TaxID=3390997 RepID=UPI003B9DD989
MSNIDEIVGQNVQRMRTSLGVGREAFARDRFSSDLGYSRHVIYAIETGTRHCTVTDVLALSEALDCTVADLLASSDPVMLADDHEIDVAARLRSPDESPDARAWSYFESAGDALAEARNAWDRYVAAMDAVRRRVAKSPPLRERIERMLAKRLREHAEYAVELFEFRPPDEFEGYDAWAAANPTPGIVTARDALDRRALHPHLWRARPRATSSRENVRPSETAN